MNILIAEDNLDKKEELKGFLRGAFKDIFIYEASSLKSTMKCLRRNEIDVLLLDMSMPSSDNGFNKINPFAGEQVLNKIYLNSIPVKAIIVSMYTTFGKDHTKTSIAELGSNIERDYGDICFGTVKFSFTDNTWKKELQKYLEKLGVD